MASNKRLKKAVRERMARTGERYTTAREIVLAKLAKDATPYPSTTDSAKEKP